MEKNEMMPVLAIGCFIGLIIGLTIGYCMKNKKRCHSYQIGGQMFCAPCGMTWDANDPEPPACLKVDNRTKLAKASTGLPMPHIKTNEDHIYRISHALRTVGRPDLAIAIEDLLRDVPFRI